MALTPLAIAGALAALTLAAPTSGHGDKTEAVTLLRDGNALFTRGDYRGALVKFQEAYAAYPSAKIFFNEGQAYVALDEPAHAADAFYTFLTRASADTNLTDTSVEAARRALRRLADRVVLVQVQATPPGTSLTLDGHPVRADFHLLKAQRRAHTLRATASGHLPLIRTITVAQAEKWAAAHRPLVLKLTAKAAGLSTLGAAAASPPPETHTRIFSRRYTAAWVALGIGAGLAVGATAMGVAALHQKSALGCGGSANPCTGGQVGRANAAHRNAQIADLLWLGAAVAGGTGGVLWYVAAKPGPGSGGEVGLVGHF